MASSPITTSAVISPVKPNPVWRFKSLSRNFVDFFMQFPHQSSLQAFIRRCVLGLTAVLSCWSFCFGVFVTVVLDVVQTGQRGVVTKKRLSTAHLAISLTLWLD